MRKLRQRMGNGGQVSEEGSGDGGARMGSVDRSGSGELE